MSVSANNHITDSNEILRSLFSENPEERLHAITSLKKLDVESATILLIHALDTDDIEIRQIVGATILSLGKPVIPILIANFHNNSRFVVDSIVKILSELCDSSNTPPILNLLNDKNPVIRASVITVLGSIKDNWTIPYLRDFTKDPDSQVRAAAARTLGNLNDSASVDLLLQLLTDENPEVKITAIEALAKLNDPRACDNLWQISTDDKDATARNAALRAIKSIGEAIVKPYQDTFLTGDVNARNEMIQKLSSLGHCVILPLIEYTKHYNSSVREIAAVILGNIGDNTATKRLTELINDIDPKVRISAITALGKIKGETTIKFLISYLKHPDPIIVGTATNSLISRGSEIIKFLPNILSEQDMNSQITVTRLLAKIQEPNLIDMLSEYLKDSRKWIRRAVCFALGETRNPFAANLLAEKCLFDEDTLVRAAAAQALGKLKIPLVLDTLVSALDDSEDIVKIAALKAIGETRDKDSGRHILRFLADSPILLKITAIQTLAKIEYIGAIPLLKKLTRGWPFGNEPDEIRIEAKQALKILEKESHFDRP